MKITLLIISFCLIFSSEAISGGAAPYTKAAIEKIHAVAKETGPPKFGKSGSQKEKARKYFEYQRNLFKKAGFNYYATIDKVVFDMRHQPEVIPQVNADDSVFGYIYITLNMMMEQCEYSNIDCLQFFPSKTAKSVRWLAENTDFSF